MWKKSYVTGTQNKKGERQEIQDEVTRGSEGQNMPKGIPTEGNKELSKGINQGIA